jgi:Tfp pilus assembly protein PilF
MAKIHVVSALLVGTPFLQSCTSIPATDAALDVKAATAGIARQQPGENPAVYYQLGRFYQAQNRFDAAAAAYEKALAIDTRFYEARNGLGVIYAAQGKHDRAIEQFRIALAQAPLAAHLHNNLAQAYFLQGKYPEAVASFESAAKFDPYNSGTLVRLSQAYAKAGLPGKSQAALRKAQSAQAQSNVAAQSLLGQPGAVAREQSPSEVSAAIEGVGGSVVSRTAPATTTATITAAATPGAATPSTTTMVAATTAVQPGPSSPPVVAPSALSRTTDLITSRTEVTGKLVPVSPDVYELVVPKATATRSPLPAIPVFSSAIPATSPLRLESSESMKTGGSTFGDMRITAVAPGIFQLETPAAVVQPRAAPTALAARSNLNVKPVQPVRSQPIAASALGSKDLSRPSISRVRLEVSNANGVTGLAKRVSAKLREFEHYVARLTNQRPPQSDTSVEYRDGYIEEAASIAADLQKRVALVPSDNLRRDIHVRLVLGRDMRSNVAFFQNNVPSRAAATATESPVSVSAATQSAPELSSSAGDRHSLARLVRQTVKQPAALLQPLPDERLSATLRAGNQLVALR